MAGGRGERFWPRSRKDQPKQLLNLLGGKSFLEQTVLRLQGFVSEKNIFIITNGSYVDRIRQLCSQLPPENVIGEPCARDTAPCMALAAGIVKAAAKTPDPVMLLLPSDHFIVDRNAMISDFKSCCDYALKEDALATIGIVPVSPCPNYGYIECGEILNGPDKISRVKCFREKPSVEEAVRLLASGNYKWNSGMFVFPLKTIRREMQRNAPDLLSLSDRIAEVWGTPEFDSVLRSEYEAAHKISIDYAIMEHAEKIVVKDAAFDWDDIGSWTALRNHLSPDANGNVSSSDSMLLDCKDCIVFSEDRGTIVAGIDLKDMIVVKTDDAVLVCPVKSAPKIKSLLAALSGDTRFRKYL